MSNINTYDNMSIDVLRATDRPAEIVGLAMGITMRSTEIRKSPSVTSNQCQYLLNAEHTSLFEHVSYTFLIGSVSRSFLAQITRQRTACPTSGSQHYQNYRDYPMSVHPGLRNASQQENFELTQDTLNASLQAYELLIERGVAKEEARQVLPNAATVNYLWTINARNLVYFLRQRCCNRNVYEMRVFANRVLVLVRTHFPELFDHVGPQCFMDSNFSRNSEGCRQGKLQCTNKFWRLVT